MANANIWFYLDGTSSRYALVLRTYLYEIFLNKSLRGEIIEWLELERQTLSY